MKNNNLKSPLILVTYGILLYYLVTNLSVVTGFVNFLLALLSPVFIGIGIAFIVNLLLRFFEINILNKLIKKEKLKKLKRPLGMILAYFSTFLIVGVIINFIIPQITISVKSLIERLPKYAEELSIFLQSIMGDYDVVGNLWTSFVNNIDKVITNASQVLNVALPQILNITKGLTSGIVNIFLGFVFSIYMLASKEKLLNILKKLVYVIFEKKTADKITEVCYSANKVFRSFIGGQIIESVILGILCFIGMTVFRMPYAPLVSVIVGLTSLVPVLGTYIGIIVSAFLILLESPVMAFWFVVFIIILQQIEGNLIYPKVVGNAIGLGGLWVLLAVVVGGSMFGVLGILLGVPVMAVLYALVRKYVDNKLKSKDIIL